MVVLFVHTDHSHNVGTKHSTAYKKKSKGAVGDGGVAPSAICGSRDASMFLFKSLGKIKGF